MTAPAPPNEAARLEALRRYRIVDTAAEQTFDEITALAAHVSIAPMAQIAFVESEREWYKSKVGLTMTGAVRELGFAGHAILQLDLFTVEDATVDPRFATNPLVTAYPYIRFYAGAALVTPTGHVVGALAVLDRLARKLRPEQEEALRALGRQVVTQLELRRNLIELERTVAERAHAEAVLRESERRFRELVESAPDAIVIADRRGRVELANGRTEAMFGYRREDLLGKPVETLMPERFRDAHAGHRAGYLAEPRIRSMGASLDIIGRHADGRDFPIEVSLSPMGSGDELRVIAFIRESARPRPG